MSANAIWRSVYRAKIPYLRSIASASLTPSVPTSGVTKPPTVVPQTLPKAQPGTTSTDKLRYDEQTHTGQAWDEEDHRLVRFTYKDKEVNPNVAMRLIAEIPPQPTKERVIACDGGNGALGHPKVYINLDKPGNHACGYCGLRFYKEDLPHDGSEHIQV